MHQPGGVVRRVVAGAAVLAVVGGTAVVINQGLSSAGNIGDNILDHSGFRMGGEGWDVQSSSSVDVRRSSPGAVGSQYALRMQTAERADVALVDPPQGRPGAEQDRRYRAVVYVRANDPSMHGEIRLQELRGSDVVGTRATDFALTEGGWQRVVLRYQAHASDTQLRTSVRFANVGPQTPVYVDHVWVSPIRSTSDRPNTPSAPSRSNSGTLFGASVYQAGQSWPDAVAASDRRYGGLDVVRVFHPGLPDAWPGRSGAVNRPVVVSFKAQPAEVLSGRLDDRLISWFKSAPRDRDIWWSYFHEPEDNVKRGDFSAQQWREAYRRIAGFADRAANPALHNTVILMCWTANPHSGRSLNDFFPGRDVVDTIGWDCYNKSDSYLDPDAMFGRAIAASKNFGVGFGIAELGSKLHGGSADRAAWLRAVARHLSAQGAEFVTYFDSKCPGGEFRLLDSASQQAWREAVAS